MPQFLVDLLQDDSFKTLDRAHRTLRAKPNHGQSSSAFFCFQQGELVLTIVRKKEPLTYQGHRIFHFSGLSNALDKSGLVSIKSRLYQIGIKLSLRHPAVLCFTHQLQFHTAEDTEKYFKQHLDGQ